MTRADRIEAQRENRRRAKRARDIVDRYEQLRAYCIEKGIPADVWQGEMAIFIGVRLRAERERLLAQQRRRGRG